MLLQGIRGADPEFGPVRLDDSGRETEKCWHEETKTFGGSSLFDRTSREWWRLARAPLSPPLQKEKLSRRNSTTHAHLCVLFLCAQRINAAFKAFDPDVQDALHSESAVRVLVVWGGSGEPWETGPPSPPKKLVPWFCAACAKVFTFYSNFFFIFQSCGCDCSLPRAQRVGPS